MNFVIVLSRCACRRPIVIVSVVYFAFIVTRERWSRTTGPLKPHGFEVRAQYSLRSFPPNNNTEVLSCSCGVFRVSSADIRRVVRGDSVLFSSR